MSNREGSLEAPTRHPIDWRNPAFTDQDALDKELDALEADPSLSTDSLWVVASSGAALSQHNKDRLAALLPGRMVVDSLGSSETGVLGPKAIALYDLPAR